MIVNEATAYMQYNNLFCDCYYLFNTYIYIII